MKTVVLINGFPGAGKDTFVEICSELYPDIINLHTSNPAKAALAALGWDGEKTDNARKLLAYLNEAAYLYFDGPTKYVLSELEKASKRVSFVHIREPGRITRLKHILIQEGYDVATLLINNPRVAYKEYNNESDKNVLLYPYDYYIDNDSSVYALRGKAQEFIKKLLYPGGNVK